MADKALFTETTVKGTATLTDGSIADINPFKVYALNGKDGKDGSKGERGFQGEQGEPGKDGEPVSITIDWGS